MNIERTPDGGARFGQIRSCYVNFAEHLLNAYSPNVASPVEMYRWTDADWFRFVDQIAALAPHFVDVAADLPFTDYLVSVLKRLGFRSQEKVVTAGSYWTTIGNERTRAQIGFANWVQDYPHPLDWFRLLDGRTKTPTHNSNYANFDVGWVNREIERLTRPKKLTPRVDRRWAALDRRVMRLAPWAPFLNQEGSDFFSSRVRLGCYVNNVLYEFDYASICVNK